MCTDNISNKKVQEGSYKVIDNLNKELLLTLIAKAMHSQQITLSLVLYISRVHNLNIRLALHKYTNVDIASIKSCLTQ